MSRPEGLVAFSRVADTPLHYSRPPVSPYGCLGKGPRTCYLMPDFLAKLNACFAELWQVARWGKAEAVVTAGAWVDKPGRHGDGRAFDIDSIWWLDEPPLVTMQAPEDARRYLGVQAVLMRHFGTVLGWWYNKAHRGHWHLDDGTEPGWGPASHSRVSFLQAALTHVWGIPTDIDGKMGPQTRENSDALLAHLGLSDGLYDDWLSFLADTAREGLSV